MSTFNLELQPKIVSEFVVIVPRRKVGRRKTLGAHMIINSKMMTFMGCTQDGLHEVYMSLAQIKVLARGITRGERAIGYRILMWAASRYQIHP